MTTTTDRPTETELKFALGPGVAQGHARQRTDAVHQLKIDLVRANGGK